MNIFRPVLVKKYSIRKAGTRSQIVTIPDSYMEDMNLRPTDKLCAYRSGDALIFVPEGSPAPILAEAPHD